MRKSIIISILMLILLVSNVSAAVTTENDTSNFIIAALGICFFFVYFANSLDEEHTILKWFFRFIALIGVFGVYHAANVLIQLNTVDLEAISPVFSFTVYGRLFWVILAYFLIYILYKIFMSFKHNKEWDWNNRFVK